MARAREFAPIVQVGIRSMSLCELPYADKERIFYSHELYYDKSLYGRAIEKLSENVYITIDLDVFDPSIMPSTGTPEPGGPEYFELLHFLRDLIRKKNVVGFDVVELCPSQTNKTPDFIAAKIIYQLLSYRFAL
jgi:agmatinase